MIVNLTTVKLGVGGSIVSNPIVSKVYSSLKRTLRHFVFVENEKLVQLCTSFVKKGFLIYSDKMLADFSTTVSRPVSY